MPWVQPYIASQQTIIALCLQKKKKQKQAIGHNWAKGSSLLASVLDNRATLDSDLPPPQALMLLLWFVGCVAICWIKSVSLQCVATDISP